MTKKLHVTKLIIISGMAMLFMFAGAGNALASHENIQKNLYVGAKGADVVTLQTWLTKEGHLSGVFLNGTYDNPTREAVRTYQQQNNIQPTDGLFGPITRSYVQAEARFKSTDTTASEKAVGLRLALNHLLKEHVSLGLETLRAAYDGSESFEGAFSALDENSKAIAGAVGSVYGDEAESSFLEVWRGHIVFFADYTTGLKTNDDDMVDQAIADLKGYAKTAGAFFSGANPHIPADAVESLAMEHGRLVRESMMAYDQENYVRSFEIGREATEQVGMIADALAGGIVMQFPELF